MIEVYKILNNKIRINLYLEQSQILELEVTTLKLVNHRCHYDHLVYELQMHGTFYLNL